MDELQAIRPSIIPQLGLACNSCYTSGVKLQRCSKCRRMAYCSSECQKRNWSKHKAFCNALHKIENDPFSKSMLSFSASSVVPQDLDLINMFIAERIQNETQLCEFQLRRPLKGEEHALLVWEPRCLACGQSERLLRMQSSNPNSVPALIPCKHCNVAFCCSETHWDVVRDLHTATPCDDVYGELSQCQLNQRLYYDWTLEQVLFFRGGHMVIEKYPWRPKAKKSTWTPLKGLTWNIFFDDFVQERCTSGRSLTEPEIDARFRAVTDYLSMPMSILYALEGMNDDSGWRRKKTLIIHVLGAMHIETFNRGSMEQILHHVPAISTLQIMYCGGDLHKVHPPLDFEKLEHEELCEKCQSLEKKMTYEYYPNTYHSYIQSEGDHFTQPDLAIAFDSALFESHIPSWTTTIKEAVRRKIPTIFTAYRASEAKKEGKIIADAGATLIPGLGPCLNPFGSMLARPKLEQLTGFQAANAWLSGAFRS